uniref:Carboxylic ester hydrolase n=1 Tax=Fopius arisanus TaxID=64838 RepID=A0A0C9Q317_9HYME
MKRLLVSISLLLLWTCLILAGPRVKIRNGRLEGSIMRSRKGRDIFAFRGIPYARPPVGELRFEPPQPAASWKGIRSAQDDGNICPQQEYMHIAARMIGSEDCLYLNVFTPELPGVSKKNIYPVLVWIHGGGWFVGSGSSKLYGPQYLLDYEIILVTLNYRLGPLGLLSTGDDVIPGNFAFKDQVLALHWVQENIAAFGGDPGRVTIAGDSAGGTSVHYLMLSRLARGLFHQAIAESGSAVNNWAYNPPNLSRNKTHRLAKELGCPVTTSQKIRDCLSKINASVINGQTAGWPVINGFPFLKFRPVLESNKSGAFLIDTAEELMKHGEFSDVPWLLGVNAQEGSIFTIGLYLSPDQRELKRFNDNFFDLAPILLQLDPACPKDDLKTICQKLRHYYLKNKIIDESNRRSFIDVRNFLMHQSCMERIYDAK